MLLKRLRPSIWLPSIMVAWGIVVSTSKATNGWWTLLTHEQMTLMGLVKDFNGLLIARIFLGVTEAGLFPGVVFCGCPFLRMFGYYMLTCSDIKTIQCGIVDMKFRSDKRTFSVQQV